MMSAMVSDADRRRGVLRRRTLQTLVLLMVEFLLGAATSLYVTIPTHHQGAGSTLGSLLWSFASGLPLLVVHVVVGMLLLVSGIELVMHAVRGGRRATVWLAALGLAGILLAAIAGAVFVSDGQNAGSMLMSVGFAVTAVCYVVILSLSA
jgi:uncharacterized BrkB/YihY/UPF0761 family membrane protein